MAERGTSSLKKAFFCWLRKAGGGIVRSQVRGPVSAPPPLWLRSRQFGDHTGMAAEESTRAPQGEPTAPDDLSALEREMLALAEAAARGEAKDREEAQRKREADRLEKEAKKEALAERKQQWREEAPPLGSVCCKKRPRGV